jgi:hypothetical protein
VWLVYRPDLAFLEKPDAALTLPRAQRLPPGDMRGFDAERQRAPSATWCLRRPST